MRSVSTVIAVLASALLFLSTAHAKGRGAKGVERHFQRRQLVMVYSEIASRAKHELDKTIGEVFQENRKIFGGPVKEPISQENGSPPLKRFPDHVPLPNSNDWNDPYVGMPELAVRVGKSPFDRNIDLSPVDRKVAARLAASLSTEETAFVFYCKPQAGPNVRRPTSSSRLPASRRSINSSRLRRQKPAPPRQNVSCSSASRTRSPRPAFSFHRYGRSFKTVILTAEEDLRREGYHRTMGVNPPAFGTKNPERAHRNLAALNKQDPARFGEVAVFKENELETLAERLQLTPERGDHAQVVLITGRNIPEFRAAVRKAGEAQRLRGKQVWYSSLAATTLWIRTPSFKICWIRAR